MFNYATSSYIIKKWINQNHLIRSSCFAKLFLVITFKKKDLFVQDIWTQRIRQDYFIFLLWILTMNGYHHS